VLMFGAQAGATGALQTAQTLPFLLASLPAGILVDRVSRARLMASAEALRVLSLAAILALMPLALAIGEGASMEQPLEIAIIAGLVAQLPLVLVVLPVLLRLFRWSPAATAAAPHTIEP